MRDDYINEHYAVPLKTSTKNYVNFIKINMDDFIENMDPEEIDSEIEFLVQRVSQNMCYYKQHIRTAVSDYHFLVALLIKKGMIFKEFQAMKGDPNGYEALQPYPQQQHADTKGQSKD